MVIFCWKKIILKCGNVLHDNFDNWTILYEIWIKISTFHKVSLSYGIKILKVKPFIHTFNNISYPSKGWKIQTGEQDSFQECEFCTENDCDFKSCSESLVGPIFCKSMSDTSQSQISTIVTTSHESFSALTFMSNHSTTKQPLVLDSTTGHYDKDQSASSNDTLQILCNFILLCKWNNCCYILPSFFIKFFKYKMHRFSCQWRISFENILASRFSFHHYTVMCFGSFVLCKVIYDQFLEYY